jgi:hypothetical protein
MNNQKIMDNQKINMASEFWFFSQLHRLGYQAYITLGNTKAVDIAVQLRDHPLITFDVKGKESFKKGHYRLGKVDMIKKKLQKDNHFFAFIGLQIREKSNNRIDFDGDPECFIIEAKKLEEVALWAKARIGISPELKNDNDAALWLWPDFLGYLKNGSSVDQKKIANRVKEFKEYRAIEGEIDFKKYNQIIMTLKDFENKHHNLKII